MLRRNFDPFLPHRAVLYLRVSSELQNKRSPEQQQAEIELRLNTLSLPWSIITVYRDDAKSGRVLSKRKEYQQMINDIKGGTVDADLILVDTIERFGRVDELPVIRKQLYERNGVLVLTADSNFADPTSTAGRALGFVESMRATEHGRILGHNVLRGKRDTAQLKHWPGGPPPFGMKLESIMKNEKGREVVDYSVLVPDPDSSWIVSLVFKTADETNWGTTRLARFLNEHEKIPNKFKPFHPPSIGYWLDNPIYFGTLRWERCATGIVDDMRVVERNAEEDVTLVPDFCEAILPLDLCERVQALRQARRDRQANALREEDASNGKQIKPPAPGLALKYLLSGLVFCGECGLRMTLSSSGTYRTKAGESKRYPAYVCPGHRSGICENGTRVPEEWLRRVTIERLCERLFPQVIEND